MVADNENEKTAKSEKSQEAPLISPRRSLLQDYGFTIGMLSVYAVMLYFAFLQIVNQPPPSNQLQWLSGKIVTAQEKHPNFRVELSDGSVRNLDVHAGPIGPLGETPRFHGASLEELAKLQGCQAEIGYDHMHWSILTYPPRVWEIRCDAFSMPYAKMVSQFGIGKQYCRLGFWRDAFCINFINNNNFQS